MTNMLAWLTGRDDRTQDPWPFQPQQPQAELRVYNPTPSERIGQWLQSGLMGLGADPYRAGHIGHGVRDILQATPLGIGMSAADVAHAKAADDPMGVAAAALGMVPGMRPVTKTAGNVSSEIKQAIAINASGTHKIDPATGKTVANLPSNEGYTLSSAASKDFPDAAKDYFIHDPSGKKIGELTHNPEEVHSKDWITPEHWKLSMEGVAEKAVNSLEDVMKYVPGWHKQTAGTPAPPKQVLDYEKDDNGLYHIFDAISGKTVKVVDTELQAKAALKQDWGTPKSIPINQISTPSPKEVKAPDLLEAQKRYEEAVAPIFQNLPERAMQQGYTTPAFRGLKIREGDVARVHDFERASQQYSTTNPMLADMYADYLSKHPGWQIPDEAFDKGASVSPLLLDTSKYHYYDAAGAHWSSSAGNKRGIEQAQAKGAPGVIVDNVWDEPNSTHALGTPSKIFITFPSGASTVKSRFAERFDPTSPDMLKNFAGLAAGGTGIAALLGSDRAEAAAPQRAQAVPPQPLSERIAQIIDSLDWQDQWMGRMKLPLQQAAGKLRGYDNNFNTVLGSEEEKTFQQWKNKYAPKDSGNDYDLRGAFTAGLTPGKGGHWSDLFKKPNHPTFSNESKYAKDNPNLAGYWFGDTFIPPAIK